MITTSDQLEARRAVESMRSGVPSAAAVRTMGSGQAQLEHQFRELLKDADQAYSSGRQLEGLLLRAGFGEGKSHLLTCFEHVALDLGYAVSRVVISKETPLQIPSKVLAAAVESLRVPGRIGRGLGEIGVSLHEQLESPEYRRLVEMLQREDGLNSRFAATLSLFEKGGAQDEELGDKILRFWSGDKLNVADVKRCLREIGDGQNYRLEPIRARELAIQTMSFLPHLIRAAGFKGLVLLIDEVELIGRYTRLGRAQSYAELARWIGADERDQRPGLVTVAAVTSDYAHEVLIGKQDLDLNASLLAARDAEAGGPCLNGMKLIQKASLLESPSEEVKRGAYSKLKNLHGQAYAWTPPEVTWPETLGATPMRTYVRAWINGWDVRRLYPDSRADEGGYVIDNVVTGYDEEPELETFDQAVEDA